MLLPHSASLGSQASWQGTRTTDSGYEYGGGLSCPKPGRKSQDCWAYNSPPPPVTRVRVRGYGISMGLVSGSQSAAQREADRVFGANTVKVQRCQHLKHSGLVNPVFDMDITGVPPD